MLTEQRLSEIRARLKAATPGPWQVWDGPEYVGGGADLCIGAGESWLVNMDHRSCLTLQQLVDEGPSHAPVGNCPICSLGEADITGEQRANAEFIANARADIEALVAEVERLHAEVDEWKGLGMTTLLRRRGVGPSAEPPTTTIASTSRAHTKYTTLTTAPVGREEDDGA